jgi:DNA polymerase-3 subunit gamma/tau
LISASHHQDVIEIDAASKTGVDDIREIIDSIAYAPVLAKYKVYIIDEVHMLSNNAFNALLKTLEEPPPHVKFIFATTEIRKVPITILSRCQRFDLRRLDEKEIAAHLKNILVKENFEVEDRALEIISKTSEGSVRDSLSLLDQALALNNHNRFLSAELIEKMLNLSDQTKIIELFKSLMTGEFVSALKIFNEINSFSSDILQILSDLLNLNHKITLVKLTTVTTLDSYSESQCKEIINIAGSLSLSSLTRVWQMLSKAVTEISYSSSQKISFEMLMVRICYIVSLPDLKQILLELNEEKNPTSSSSNSFDAQKSDDLIGEILRNFEGSKIV